MSFMAMKDNELSKINIRRPFHPNCSGHRTFTRKSADIPLPVSGASFIHSSNGNADLLPVELLILEEEGG
jgi:hypothetical protein